LLEHLIALVQAGRDGRLLASLDDRKLREIGVDRTVVENDSAASFWRVR
jgi:uncharacterized protein YjiS (DUF1127 family)